MLHPIRWLSFGDTSNRKVWRLTMRKFLYCIKKNFLNFSIFYFKKRE